MLRDSLNIYKRLFPYVAPYRKKFVLSCVCTLPLSLCSAGLAYLMKPAIDEMFLNKDMLMLKLIPLGVVALYAVKGTFEYTYHYLLGSIAQRIITDIRNRIYAHLQTLSLSFFIKTPTGVLMSRVTNDVNLLQYAVNTGVIHMVKGIVTIIGLTAVLFVQDFTLACIAFVILPWAVIPIWRFGKKSRKFSTRGQKKIGKISTFVHETITGCRIVKAFGMEGYENRRFSEENMRLVRIRMKRLKVRSLAAPVMECIGGCAGAAVMLYGGYNVLSGSLTPGEFFSFLTALLLLYGPARNMSTAYQGIQEGLAAAVRVFEVLDIQPDIQEASDAVELPRVKGRVAFESVSFAYNETPVLTDVNLDVQPAETIAVVGMTGSGKTTLINLIPRFFDCTAGRITIDGYDVAGATIRSLRSRIAFVSQHPFLFNDTVRSNISYGNPQQSEENIIAAARLACAHEFIEEMPDGYDTVIGEHGEKLSGGQRQRIAIARAVLKDAPIVILDEATAALDTQIEKRLQHALDKFLRDKTTFVISHRLSTIKNADRIIVIAEGRIVEQGTHDELFSRGGEYTKLYSIYLQDDIQPAAQNS